MGIWVGSLLLALVAWIGVVAALRRFQHQRELEAIAEDSHCLLCDGSDCQTLVDGYRCLACGFQSVTGNDPRASLVSNYLALKEALRCFDEAEKEFGRADSWARVDVSDGIPGSGLVKNRAFDRANKNLAEGLRLAQEFLSAVPAGLLAKVAAPDTEAGRFVRFSDYFFDNRWLDVRILNRIQEARSNLGELVQATDAMQCVLRQEILSAPIPAGSE